MPLAAAIVLAASWPASAYAVSPLVVPALVALAAVVVVVLRRPDYGVALALAAAPFTNLRLGGAGKPFQLLIPALAFGVLLYAALVVTASRLAYSRWLILSVCIFCGVAVVSTIVASDTGAAVKKLFIVLTATALLFAVFTICRDEGRLRVVVGGALCGLLLASVQGVSQYYLHRFSGVGFLVNGSLVVRAQGSFGHPNQFGGYLALLIPLAVAVTLSRAYSRGLRWLAATALVFALPALVFSFSRGALVALVLGGLIWLGIVRPRTAIVAAVVTGVVFSVAAPSTLRARLDPQASRGDIPLRADIWRAAVEIYGRHPLIGVGLNNFSEAYARLPSTIAGGSQRRLLENQDLVVPPHAQNLYLNILAEEGIVGLGAFALFAMASLLVAYRASRLRHDGAGRAVGLAIGVGLMGLAVHSMLEVTLFSELALPLFAVLGVAASHVALSYGRPEISDGGAADRST